ncbi:ATP-binding cassette domain-containing protein [Sphingomonas sp. HITSZ_GF]|uniref:ATP-binding cassette domain-containing protein n=1 Tax=Sphingomonas sp. HITSZ_GF TaxID=3037247 RepID=UPI00240DE31F|nr:ATP-binding cassette domain-containing protein [Sphingomonas sp. HITSZ_GF]MDG2535519.1 ATP-binding cassette domain-containing protein [Sphingomonas sp. HITSZ_GF]
MLLLSVHDLEACVGQDVQIRVPEMKFEAGKLHLLVGDNGSGKTSLVRAILGLIPSRGRIVWEFSTGRASFNQDLRKARERVFQHLGYVQQSSNSLWPQFTTQAHVEQALRNRQRITERLSPAEFENKVVETLNLARIAKIHWARKPHRHSFDGISSALSGGERQRISYARARAADPEVLVFDELEASLDRDTRRQFIDSILREFLAKPEHTAIVVSHDPVAWLQGEWDPGDRQVWRVTKADNGTIGVDRDRDAERKRASAPQDTMSRREILDRMLAPIRKAPPSDDNGQRLKAGQSLAHAVHEFVCGQAVDPAGIVTVVGRPHGASPALMQACLLGVAGNPGYAPDGEDKHRIAQFLQAGAFSAAASLSTPAATPPLDKGLVVDLLNRPPEEEAFTGNRLDRVVFDGNVVCETFLFSEVSGGDLERRRQRYLELSKATKQVYLFRASRLDSTERLVVGIDFLDQIVMDPYQCYFVMEAIARVLRYVQ